jgi:hypothetical protein
MDAAGVRIGWADLPARVRSAVEEIVGGAVVEAVSQTGGFSPGTADRVRTAEGARAFVKAVGAAVNPHTIGLHRAEARVAALLPELVPAPRLLGVHDSGDWIALVLQDIPGGTPATPWRPDELRRVLDALDALAVAATPAPVPGLPAAVDLLADDLASWDHVAADPPPDLHPWALANLDLLRATARRGIAALTGDTLVHLDVRADNLITGPGGVTLVDWPWACRGPSWLDSTMLLTDVCLHGGHDVSALLSARARAHGAARADLRAVLVGVAGFTTEHGRRPPPPGLPTVRAFQRAQSAALLAWLAEDFAGR